MTRPTYGLSGKTFVVSGTYYCSQNAAKIMKEQGEGKIVNMSSTAAYHAAAEDIVHPVLFLCSGGADFITGQVINVDGGLTAK